MLAQHRGSINFKSFIKIVNKETQLSLHFYGMGKFVTLEQNQGMQKNVSQ